MPVEKQRFLSDVLLNDPDEFIYDTLLSGDLALVGTKRPEATYIEIPPCVAVIKENAFRDNQTVRSIVIPHTVTTIEDEAFMGAVNLETVRFPSSLVHIGHRAFLGCEKLREGVAFYDSLRFVGDDAFGACTSLAEIPCESEALLADRRRKDALVPSCASHIRLVLMEKKKRDTGLKEKLKYVMDIGEQMLRSGAEVHRVEDTVSRICCAFGATAVDVLVITSSMVISVADSGGAIYTQTRRITSIQSNFDRLDKLNRLSRRICGEGLSVEQIKAELEKIARVRCYSFFSQCLIYAVIAAAFTLFFGGTAVQGVVGFAIGALLCVVEVFADITMENTVFSKFLSAFALTALAFAAEQLGLVPRTDEVIIGNIMLLIPGLGFTNALRDLFTGDSIAGSLRVLEAVLAAAAIAAGYFLFVFISGGGAV